jgi:sulfotransferase family protein
MCSFVPDDFLAAYVDTDPSVKLILTERDPDAWVRSMASTIGAFAVATHQWPFAYCRYFDSDVDTTCGFVDDLVSRWTRGKALSPEGLAAARQFYVD